jgi:hypothetical protein
MAPHAAAGGCPPGPVDKASAPNACSCEGVVKEGPGRHRHWGEMAVSFASSAMARTHTLTLPASRSAVEQQCPSRIISAQLLDAAGRLLRVLFLDQEGHISPQPRYLPREETLILAANQQRMPGAQARVHLL